MYLRICGSQRTTCEYLFSVHTIWFLGMELCPQAKQKEPSLFIYIILTDKIVYKILGSAPEKHIQAI